MSDWDNNRNDDPSPDMDSGTKFQIGAFIIRIIVILVIGGVIVYCGSALMNSVTQILERIVPK